MMKIDCLHFGSFDAQAHTRAHPCARARARAFVSIYCTGYISSVGDINVTRRHRVACHVLTSCSH